MTDAAHLEQFIRDIPDFPKPGILFKDITPLLANPEAFVLSLSLLEERLANKKIDKIVGMESRGFIFGAALAARLGKPFVPARKPGKLPAKTVSVTYDLEYGSDSLEIHEDGISSGEQVLIVDDLIATGGTAEATAKLVEKMGAEVAAFAFVIELSFLEGTKRLGEREVISLISY